MFLIFALKHTLWVFVRTASPSRKMALNLCHPFKLFRPILRIYILNTCIWHSILGDLANFIKNSEWIIDEFPVEKHVLYYNCCPEPYPDITFTVIMQVKCRSHCA